MKKVLFIFILFLSIGFMSCSHDFETYSIQDVKEAEYSTAFVNKYGTINPSQTWGFTINTTRSASTNGNQWEGQGYTIPSDITDSELQAVLNIFSKKGEASYESLIDWDCFFVQQVYKGDSTYVNHAGGTVVGSEHMDWLCTVTNKHVNVISWYPYQEEIVLGDYYDDHINNFNNGNAGGYWTSDGTGTVIKQMMLMVNTNSNKFGFKSSEDNGHVFYNFRMEQINGNYYVGFDFEANGNNPNEKVDRDYVYDDWIVKIVPGIGTTPDIKEQGRIICEDMGGIGDFDFNDVVFDAIIYNDGTTQITLLAAGGTLDVTVAGEKVWEKLGKMVNTGAGATHDPYTFITSESYNSLIDIPIIVYPQGWGEASEMTHYILKADIGTAPQKICVPLTFRWCKEYAAHSIDKAYPGFKDWVENGNFWSGETVEEHLY